MSTVYTTAGWKGLTCLGMLGDGVLRVKTGWGLGWAGVGAIQMTRDLHTIATSPQFMMTATPEKLPLG